VLLTYKLHARTHCDTPAAMNQEALQVQLTHCNMQCNTLQHAATHCHTLQHSTTHHNTLAAEKQETLEVHLTQCNTHCNTMPLLQHTTATHCNKLQRTSSKEAGSTQPTHCNTAMQHTAKHTETHRNTPAARK